MDPEDRIEPAAAAIPELKPGESAAAGGEKPAAGAAAEDWRDRRIAQQTARLHERNAEVTARETRIAELEAQIAATTKPAEGGAPAPTEAEIEARITAESERRADQLATQRTQVAEFNRQCNQIVADGRAQFADFDAKLGDLRTIVTPGDKQSEDAYWGIVSAALKTGAAPKIIHQLGSDRNEAMRLLTLDPESRAIEIAKLAMKADDEGSAGLTKPLTPVGSRGAQHTAIDPTDPDRSDRLTTSEWMKRRNAQLAVETRH